MMWDVGVSRQRGVITMRGGQAGVWAAKGRRTRDASEVYGAVSC